MGRHVDWADGIDSMGRTTFIVGLLIVGVVTAPPNGFAQQLRQAGPGASPVPSDSEAGSASSAPQITELDETLERLSRGQYWRRQAATLEMWRRREDSREQVQEAARHSDPEVAGRAKWILQQWRRGSLPDSPPAVHRFLQRSKGPAAIERLLEGGQFRAAVVAVEESAGTIDREAIHQRISLALTRRFPLYAYQAVVDDTLDDLLRLIDLVADTKELALCRIQLMRQMGMKIPTDPSSLLPQASRTWTPQLRQRATVLVLMTLGQMDKARQQAASNDDLLQQCRMAAGEWEATLVSSHVRALATEAGSQEHARLWCVTLIAADRAGDRQRFDEAVDQLSDLRTIRPGPAADLRWKYLASHGEIDAAIDILNETRPDTAAQVAITASRFDRAFESLGFPADRVDLDISDWVDLAIAAQADADLQDPAPEVRRVLALIQTLVSIGRDDAAWFVARQLSQSEVPVGTRTLRDHVVWKLLVTPRTDWVLDLAVSDDDSIPSSTSQLAIVQTLADADSYCFDVVLKALAPILNGQSVRQRLYAARQLIEGEIPEGFDPENDFRRLFQFAIAPRRSSSRGRIGASGVRANLDVVRIFVRHGQPELASACLGKLVETGDLEAKFALAEYELNGGRAENAASLFQSVFDSVQRQGVTEDGLGTSGDSAIAVKSLVGLWILARRAGDEPWAARLEHQVRLALCSPSTQLRADVAEFLRERGEAMLAMETYEGLLPTVWLGTPETASLYDVARGYALLSQDRNPDEAIRWLDLAVGDALETLQWPSASIVLPIGVQRWVIETAIARDDAEAVERSLSRILQLDPLNIDVAENLLLKMRSSGMAELADRTLDQILDDGMRYARRFPFDAMTCNNLAWIAAVNDRRLDDALMLTERAVYLEPESAIYRDTYAEVLFKLGRTREALQIEQACLLDDPGQWHLHEQIDKYKAAISDRPAD